MATSPTDVELLGELGIRRSTIWPPGVDEQIFHPATDVHGRSPSAGPLKVLCVGGLAREKGFDQLAPLVARAARSGHGIELSFVGDGPDRARRERLFAGTPTVFCGVRRGAELAASYRAADVLAFPSVTETVGLVILEAAAVGLPVVAIDTVATRDTLVGYDRAVLIQPGAGADAWLLGLVEAAQLRHEPRSEPEQHCCSWGDATRVLINTYEGAIQRRWQASPLRTGGPVRPSRLGRW